MLHSLQIQCKYERGYRNEKTNNTSIEQAESAAKEYARWLQSKGYTLTYEGDDSITGGGGISENIIYKLMDPSGIFEIDIKGFFDYLTVSHTTYTVRRGYTALKTALLRRGDTLVVKSLDRLSRNKTDIKNELEYFKSNGIRLKVLDLPTTMIGYPAGQEWVLDMVNNILVEVLSSIAQQERETIRQRQAEGIAAAKAKGKHLGRPKAELPDNWNEVVTAWKAGQITAVEAMRQTGLKRSTFYKMAG